MMPTPLPSVPVVDDDEPSLLESDWLFVAITGLLIVVLALLCTYNRSVRRAQVEREKKKAEEKKAISEKKKEKKKEKKRQRREAEETVTDDVLVTVEVRDWDYGYGYFPAIAEPVENGGFNGHFPK